jgi:hypothetical protein
VVLVQMKQARSLPAPNAPSRRRTRAPLRHRFSLTTTTAPPVVTALFNTESRADIQLFDRRW